MRDKYSMSAPGVKDDTVMIENNAELNMICKETMTSHPFFSAVQAPLCSRIQMLRAVPILLGMEEILQAVKEGRATAKLQAVLTHLCPLLLLSLHLAHVSQTTCRCY